MGVSSLMRWTHVQLIYLVTFATSYVLLPALGDRQDQRYVGLLFFEMTDLSVFSRLSSMVG